MKLEPKIIILIAVIIFTLISCNQKVNEKGNRIIAIESDTIFITNDPYEHGSPLSIAGKWDTLKIIVEISDCGEWGGHKEHIYIQRNSNDEIYARFIVDTVPCNSIIEKDGVGILNDKLRVSVVDTIKILSLEDEKLISSFLQRLLELNLFSVGFSNAGTFFDVSVTNSSFSLSYWNSGDVFDTYYWDIRKKVFGDLLIEE